MTPSHRILLGFIVLMLLVFVAQLLAPSGLSAGMVVPAEIKAAAGEIFSGQGNAEHWQTIGTLWTAAFMHGSWEHILYNLLFLWMFAGLVGELVGWRWMVALLLLTAVGGSIGDTLARSDSEVPSLGASGMVMGFEGAYLGLAVRWALPWPHIFPIAYPIPPMRLGILALVGFALDLNGVLGSSSGIAHGAHLGGFLVGLFFTCFIIPAPRIARQRG